MQRLPLIFRRCNIGIKKKEKEKTERTTKYLRTIEGKWNLKGRYQFWSHFPGDQSVLFTSFPFFLFIVSRKETLPSRKEKKERKKKGEGKREIERHVPVNFHLSQPCLVLKSFECTVAIRLRRFPSYFLSSNLVKERRIIHACAYIYIYICQGIFAQEKEHEST